MKKDMNNDMCNLGGVANNNTSSILIGFNIYQCNMMWFKKCTTTQCGELGQTLRGELKLTLRGLYPTHH